MYNVYRDLYRAHYDDMLRAARHDALVRQAQAAQAPSWRQAWQARVLARCGEQLVAWGERLQAAAGADCVENGMATDCSAEALA